MTTDTWFWACLVGGLILLFASFAFERNSIARFIVNGLSVVVLAVAVLIAFAMTVA